MRRKYKLKMSEKGLNLKSVDMGKATLVSGDMNLDDDMTWRN